MKIVVLAGGISTERSVSLCSGSGICKALRSVGHQAILVDMFLGLPDFPAPLENAFLSKDGFCRANSVERNAPSLDEIKKLRGGNPDCHIGPNVIELCKLSDFVFLGLHGEDGEDGKIQATLRLLGIPYSGSSYLSSGMAMDKIITKQVMDRNGIRNANWQEVFVTEDNVEALAESLPMPCVIKTPAGGSSIGVYLPDDRNALLKGLRELGRINPRVLCEQRIRGRELTVPVLDHDYLPAIEIVPPEGSYFDYVAKYQSGSEGAREICPAAISEEQFQEMGEMALKLHHALGLSVYSRADFILDDNGVPYCLEVNTLPGMTPNSLFPKAAAQIGLSYADLCDRIVSLSLKARQEER